MDLPELIINHGPWGLVIVLLGACAVLWRHGNTVQSERVEDAKQFSREMLEQTRTLEKVMDYMGGKNG